MKHKKMKLLMAALMALTLLPLSAKASADPVIPDAKNGALAVSVLSEGQWKQAGLVYCDEYIGYETVSLEGLIAPGQDATIRIALLSGGASHLDAILLGGAAPIGAEAARKLSARDDDLIETGADGVTLTFSRPFKDKLLTVCARIESEDITKQPFLFPAENLSLGRMDETASFYTYMLDSSSGSIEVDGDIHETDGHPSFFSEYCMTGTGHPPGYTYVWVQNDHEYLYVSMDFTPDNTMDGDKDYAKVYVNTERGLREFKVSMKEKAWGIPGFTYTGKVSYQHKVYEFSIPLRELGVSGGYEAALQLAFAAYGTAAPVTYPAFVTVNKDGSGWTAGAPEIMIGYNYATAWPNGSDLMNGTYNIYADGVDTGVDITVDSAAAAATLNYYTLTLEAGTGIAGVSGAGTYLSGSSADIDAEVTDGYTWGAWSDGNTTKSRTVTVTGTLTLTANASLTTTSTPAPTPTHRPKPKPKKTPAPTPTPTPAPTVMPSPTPITSVVPSNTPVPSASTEPGSSPALTPSPTEALTVGAASPADTGIQAWLFWVVGGLLAACAVILLILKFIFKRK